MKTVFCSLFNIAACYAGLVVLTHNRIQKISNHALKEKRRNSRDSASRTLRFGGIFSRQLVEIVILLVGSTDVGCSALSLLYPYHYPNKKS